MKLSFRGGVEVSFIARGLLKAVTLLVAWYALFYICLGSHEGFHAMVATMLGAKACFITYGYLWLGPLPIPFEGVCIVLWPYKPSPLHSWLVGVAGGWGTAILIALLDRAVKPHGLWSRYLDYASNIHLGHQAVYGTVEGVVKAGLVGSWLLPYASWVGMAVGILLAWLEVNGVVNI